MLIFRLGPRTYRVEKQWARLPQSISLDSISAVSVNTKGQIMVLRRSDPFLLLFSKEGELISHWSNESIIDGHYFRVTKDGRVLVVDRDHHRIVAFNTEGEILQVIGDYQKPGKLGALFNHPTDVAVNANGEFFVSDGYGNSCVHHLSPTGELIKTWGKQGTGNGEFSIPHSILVDEKDQVLVADRENNRIQIFNQSGEYLNEIKDLYHPMNMFKDNDGYIYVTDQTPRLNMFDSEGELIGRCRTFGFFGHGVAVDEANDIYIAEMIPDSITKLVRLS